MNITALPLAAVDAAPVAALPAALPVALPPAAAVPQDARAFAERFLDALLRTTGQALELPPAGTAPALALPTADGTAPAAQEAAATGEDETDPLSALPLQAMAPPAPALQALPTLAWQVAQQLQAAAAQGAAPEALPAATPGARAPVQAAAVARTAALAIELPAMAASAAAPATLPAVQPIVAQHAALAQNIAGDAATTADATALDAANPLLALQPTGPARAEPAQAQAPADAARRADSAATPEQKLVEALGERLALNLQRGSERALIRLDPPLHGHLEIAIRHEGGAIQVHLTASHGDVVRQLQAISDGLRQDLQQRQGGEVSVLISSGTGDRGQDGRARQQAPTPEHNEPGQALAEAERGAQARRFDLDSSAS